MLGNKNAQAINQGVTNDTNQIMWVSESDLYATSA